MPQNRPSQKKPQKKHAGSSDPAVKSQEGAGAQTMVKKKMDSSKQEGDGDEESNPLEDPFEWMEWDWDPYDAAYVNTESNWEDARDDEETEDGVDEKFLSPREIARRNRERLIPHPELEALPPLTMEPNERMYYRETWGFDPVTNRQHLQGSDYRYDAWVPLDNDPEFGSLGIEMGARVDVVHHRGITEMPGTRVHTRIVFRRGDVEAAVRCAHVVLEKGPAGAVMLGTNEWEEEGLETRITRSIRQAMLPPWEHFAALKSYVAAIAEVGIGHMLRAAWTEDNMEDTVFNRAFGFNSAMQAQVLEALRAIAPGAATALWRDWMVELIENAPVDWIEARQDVLRELIESAFAPVYDEANQEWNTIRGMGAAIQELRQHVPQEWVTEHQSQIKALFGPEQDFLLLSLWETGAEVAGQFYPVKEGKLDLSSRQLKSVMEIQFRGDLSLVTELSLRNNSLTSLADLPSFSRLEKLDASSNYIEDLNDANLPLTLKEIDLNNNKLTNADIIGTMPHLVRIGLSYNRLTSIPKSQKTSQLRALTLAGNQIITLHGINDYEKLEVLDISRNKLSTITGLYNLIYLRELKIAENQIQNIDLINRLTHLNLLDLTDNQITSVHFNDLSDLRTLYLGGNPIDTGKGLQKLVSLRLLDIGFTRILDLNDLIALQNLRSLDLSGNQMLDLLPLKKLHNLERIGICKTRLLNLTPLIGMPNLQRIDLWDTQVINEEDLVQLAPIIRKKPF